MRGIFPDYIVAHFDIIGIMIGLGFFVALSGAIVWLSAVMNQEMDMRDKKMVEPFGPTS